MTCTLDKLPLLVLRPIVSCILLVCWLAVVSPVMAGPRVVLDVGVLEGVLAGDGDSIRVFRAIPFAAPPVGENRWREPQPVTPWEGVRDCTRFSAACPQTDALSRRFGIEPPVLDEDCLYLNVFAPAAEPGGALPVMVWFYGGGFSVGDASTYDMTRLSQLGAVVVTVNYRVNVFGFLAHESLSRESPRQASGNYGLLDMRAGLQWVQDNIAAFGGDPENVTIFGQSAGASAVCHLMASSRTGGLFHRAISQSSGAYDAELTLAEAEAQGARFFQALGCDDAEDPLAAARALSWQEVFAASQIVGIDGTILKPESREPRMRFGITIDGWLLEDQTPVVFARGRQQAVPLLIGSNADESDEEFTCAARYFAATHSALHRQVFRYFFTQPSKDPVFGGRGAVHAAEIPYVLRGNARVKPYFEAEDWALSEAMASAWVQFARTGDPNVPDAPFDWPRYTPGSDDFLEFGLEIRSGSDLRSEICDRVDSEKQKM